MNFIPSKKIYKEKNKVPIDNNSKAICLIKVDDSLMLCLNCYYYNSPCVNCMINGNKYWVKCTTDDVNKIIHLNL